MDTLISLPTWAQLAVLLAVLVPLAGLGAGVLLWAIDVSFTGVQRLRRGLRGSDGGGAEDDGGSADAGSGSAGESSPAGSGG